MSKSHISGPIIRKDCQNPCYNSFAIEATADDLNTEPHCKDKQKEGEFSLGGMIYNGALCGMSHSRFHL